MKHRLAWTGHSTADGQGQMDAWFCTGPGCSSELRYYFVAEWDEHGMATGQAWCPVCYETLHDRVDAVFNALTKANAGVFFWAWDALTPDKTGREVYG